jgi:hypothetical protein
LWWWWWWCCGGLLVGSWVCLDDGHSGGFKFYLFDIVVGSGWSRKKTGGLLRFGCRDLYWRAHRSYDHHPIYQRPHMVPLHCQGSHWLVHKYCCHHLPTNQLQISLWHLFFLYSEPLSYFIHHQQDLLMINGPSVSLAYNWKLDYMKFELPCIMLWFAGVLVGCCGQPLLHY